MSQNLLQVMHRVIFGELADELHSSEAVSSGNAIAGNPLNWHFTLELSHPRHVRIFPLRLPSCLAACLIWIKLSFANPSKKSLPAGLDPS